VPLLLPDLPLLPLAGNPDAAHNFRLHWLDNKELQFTMEAEKLLQVKRFVRFFFYILVVSFHFFSFFFTSVLLAFIFLALTFNVFAFNRF
jgi:hypothetical protein